MMKWREDRLLALFKVLDDEEQELLLGLAEDTAARRRRAPLLRLVAANPLPANCASLRTPASEV